MQGPQGEPGRDGNDFDVQIGNTETLAPGSSATATTNKDEEHNVIYLNLGIPEGLKGDKGDKGDTNLTNFEIVNGKLIAQDTDGNIIVMGNVTIVPKGEYSSETTYNYLDLVTYNGNSYLALKTSTNVLPTDTEYWQYITGGLSQDDIVDNLESTSTTKMLSAKQGKILQEGKVHSFDTVSSLKNSTILKTGMTVKTQGYYTSGDGGGAFYKIRAKSNSDVDNAGAILVIGNLVAEMIVHGEVNVLTWGVAKKNSSTQVCLNNLLSYYSTGNISIYFPSGEYYITETIYLPTRTKIRGDGGATTLSWYGNANTYMIRILKGNLYCMIHDLCFDGRNLAYGIYDCDPAGTGSNGVRSKIFNLVMNNMKIGILMAAMGSEFHNILCNGSHAYNDDTTIGFQITGTDNFINSCRVQTFGIGMKITGGNNRLFTIKTCVNGIGTIIENCTSGFYNIDLQENFQDNLILNNISESQLIISDQNAGIADHYLDGSDLQYSLLKMTNCKSTIITGTLGCRTQLGSGSCGNEKYALYIDKSCINITGNFTYRFVLNSQTIGLDKPLFYCVETETNKITVNNELLAGETTFSEASIAAINQPGAVQSISYSGNVISQTFKSTTVIDNVNNPPNSAMFNLTSMDDPLILEFRSDTLYFARLTIQFANLTNNKFLSVAYGISYSTMVDKNGSIMTAAFDGLDAIYDEYGAYIQEQLQGNVERVLFAVTANSNQTSNQMTIRVGEYN